jgi:hypothetical protein
MVLHLSLVEDRVFILRNTLGLFSHVMASGGGTVALRAVLLLLAGIQSYTTITVLRI